MQLETIITIAISIFSFGVFYGTLSNKIKQLESKLHDWKNIEAKVTKMEVQIDFIFEKLKNNIT